VVFHLCRLVDKRRALFTSRNGALNAVQADRPRLAILADRSRSLLVVCATRQLASFLGLLQQRQQSSVRAQDLDVGNRRLATTWALGSCLLAQQRDASAAEGVCEGAGEVARQLAVAVAGFEEVGADGALEPRVFLALSHRPENTNTSSCEQYETGKRRHSFVKARPQQERGRRQRAL